MKCFECKRAELEPTTAPDELKVGERTFTADVPAVRCPACGALAFEGPGLESFERAVAVAVADAGEVSGATFRFLRKSLGYSGTALGELLGVTVETVSRWETGERSVDGRAWALVAALVSDEAEGRTTTLNRLRAMRESPKLAKVVRLAVAPLSAAR